MSDTKLTAFDYFCIFESDVDRVELVAFDNGGLLDFDHAEIFAVVLALVDFVCRLNLMDYFLRLYKSSFWGQLRKGSQRFHSISVISLLRSHSGHRKQLGYQVSVADSFLDFLILDHFNRIIEDFYKRLLHVVNRDSICLFKVLSVGFFNFWGFLSRFFAFSDFMNEKVRCRGSSELNGVDFVGFVVSVPGDDDCSFELECSLFAHVLDDLE